MKLEKKRELASRALGIGRNRIVFNKERLAEIKEAITKEDMKHLAKEGAITIKETRGRRKIEKRENRRRAGSIKKSTNVRKREYVVLTRKLRAYLAELRRKGTISRDNYRDLRKQIRLKAFKSKSSLRGHISLKENTEDERNRKDNTKKKKRK